MKRIEIELRNCDHCDRLMPRKERPCGLEKPKAYARRRFCDHKCEAASRRKQMVYTRCRQCNELLRRKRFANGRLEVFKHFRKRRFCDVSCAVLWHDDHGTEHRFRVAALARREGRRHAA